MAIRYLFSILVLLVYTGAAITAFGSSITFDGLQAGMRTYTEAGFELSIKSLNSGEAVFLVSEWGQYHPAMFSSYAKGVITLRRLDNQPFSVKSIDIREINDKVGRQTVIFSGKKSSGYVLRSFTTDGPLGYQTFSTSDFFEDVTSLSWGYRKDDPEAKALVVYDNILLEE